MRVLIMHNAGDSSLSSGEFFVANMEEESLRARGVYVYLHVLYNDSIRKKFSMSRLLAGLNIFWSYSSFKSTKELIDKYRPDVVHFHGVLPLLTPSAFYACKKKGIPVVQTLHNFRWVCVEGGLFRNNHYCEMCLKSSGWQGVFFGCSRGSRLISLLLWLVNLFYRKTGLLYNWADKFIAVSEFVKDKYIEAGFPANNIQVKYNAAPAFSLEELSSVKEIERSGVTFIGRIAPAKGTRVIKEIVRNIEQPVNIVGDGPDLQDLKQYCQEYNFCHVKFWGQITHGKVMAIISSSKCVIIPSLCGETFSLVAVEAMECGIPVVASNVGGIVELINNSGGGIIADPNDPRSFVDAIYGLVEHQKSVGQMGRAGRQYVKEKLSGKIITDELLSIYQETINEKRTRM